MTQRINLYNKIEIKRKFPLTLQGIAIIYLAFSFLLVIDFINYMWTSTSLKNQQEQLLSDNNAAKSKLANIKQEFPTLDTSNLDKSLVDLRENIEKQSNAIHALSYEGTFSKYMIDLSRIHPPGIWLTEISLSYLNKIVSLQGESLRPGLTDNYVNTLNKYAIVFPNAKYQLRDLKEKIDGKNKYYEFFILTQRVI